MPRTEISSICVALSSSPAGRRVLSAKTWVRIPSGLYEISSTGSANKPGFDSPYRCQNSIYERIIPQNSTSSFQFRRFTLGVYYRFIDNSRLGYHRANFRLLNHLAAVHQHIHNHYDFPDGFPYSKHSKPRRESSSPQIG